VAETHLKLLRHEFGWGPLLDLDKDLQEEQWDRLTEYLEANELLVRCLELALVKDRAGIMAQMLLPPG
jgi:hypothetical protein